MAGPSLGPTPSGPTSPLSCQLAKHLLALFPYPFTPIGFPWLQNSRGYHASLGPLCLQIYLLPLLFDSIMQRSDSTESVCSSSFSHREAPGGDGRMGGGEVSLLFVSGASPWWLSLLCGSSKCETGRPCSCFCWGHW